MSVCLSLLQKSVKARAFKSYSFWTNFKREMEELVRSLGLSTVLAICTVTLPAGQWLRGYLLVAKWCECVTHHWAVSSREVTARRTILIPPFFSVGYILFLFPVRLPAAVQDCVKTSQCQCSNPSLISRQESIYCGKKWKVPTHWKILKIPCTTGSSLQTLSMPRQRQQWLRRHCARCIPQRVFWTACLLY